MNREQAELAVERLRRTWPAAYVREVLELPAAEAALVLELGYWFEAVPVDVESLLPIEGEPLRPRKAPERSSVGHTKTGRKPRARPPELLGILRRLDIPVGELHAGEVEPLQLDLEAPA